MTLFNSVLPAVGRNQLPPLKLPSIPYHNEWLPNQIIHPSSSPIKGDVLLPPILPHNSLPPLANTSPYSSCSSLSVSSFPSSPDSASDTLFPSFSSGTEQKHKQKKGSIESLLNSGSELRALDAYSFTTTKKKSSKRHAPYKKMKGLRLFSKQVCDKVAEKGITTYNEVADELTAEIQQTSHTGVVDQKNIRRRVYDALNVLMALDIITKDRKQIKWLGIPSPANDDDDDAYQQQLELEIQQEEERQKALLASIEQSKQVLEDKYKNYTRLENLVSRNRQQQQQQQESVYLPFFMVTSNQSIEANVHCPNEASLNLGSSWSIYQDTDILAKLWPLTTTVSS